MPKVFEAPPGFVLNPDYLVPELRAQRDDILRMAREARLVPEWLELCPKDEKALERFFHAAYAAGAAAEREACAKVCEEPGWNAANWCAKAIRARTP